MITGQAPAVEPKTDLHVHTSVSDGLMSPKQVLHEAEIVAGQSELAGFVFTDHSVVTWSQDWDEPRDRPTTGICPRPLWPGVEISTKYRGCKYHVLGYGHGLLSPEIAEYVFSPTRIKNDVYSALVQLLQSQGFDLPDPDAMLAGRGLPGASTADGVHPEKRMLATSIIARYLVALGTAEVTAERTLREGYETLSAAFPDRYLDTVEVIGRLRDAGVITAVAHPWWQCPAGTNSWAQVMGDLRRFAVAGLVGIEVSTRHLTVGTELERRAAGADLGLMPFAGSDFHANGRTRLGQFGLTHREIEDLRERAELVGCLL